MRTDAYIKDIVVAAVRRHSVNMDAWLGTRLWDQGGSYVKAMLSHACELDAGEMALLYAYVAPDEWTLVTTRRIWASADGHVSFVTASDVANFRAGNFKGWGHQIFERMELSSRSGRTLRCPYNTGGESMGALYAIMTLVKISKGRSVARSDMP